jgi:soluble lytic murein transglycosylase
VTPVLRSGALRSVARALGVATMLALPSEPAGAGAQSPRLGVPALDSTGIVRWTARPDSVPAWARGLVVPLLTRADSVAFWQAAALQPPLREVAFQRLAGLRLAAGDTAGADSCWALVGAGRTPWTWPALRGRAEIAMARGAAAAADLLLESVDRTGWTDAERAAWLALRVRTRAAAGDTTQAVEFARQALKVYPSQPGAARALGRLEELLSVRGERLTVGDERAAAEVEMLAGRSAAAAVRLRRLCADPGAGLVRQSAGLRLCEGLRHLRRFAEARAAVRELRPRDRAPDLDPFWTLESARIETAAGRPDSALALYALVAATRGGGLGESAKWEAGRTAEDAGRWDEALVWYAQTTRDQGPRAAGAAFRAGLLHLALGRADSAAACWAPDSSDGARFWHGVACRARGERAAGDSILGKVAAMPGYSFYRAMARETLAVHGWPGGVQSVGAQVRGSCPATDAAEELVAIGASDEAGLLLARVGARGVLPGSDAAGCDAVEEALAGAGLAYALGRPGLGIALAGRAVRLNDPDLRDATAWPRIPWLFPPAFEALFVSPRDTVVAALEPALLFAVAYQESRFDPRARSSSDALGLMQLKLATARDVARWSRDPAPTEAALFDPEWNVRYGARYLARLLRRFDGSVAAALSAYNAGPGSLTPRWRELRARGGEALLCELASNPLAQDYAKRILGFRQAYRELRPTARP